MSQYDLRKANASYGQAFGLRWVRRPVGRGAAARQRLQCALVGRMRITCEVLDLRLVFKPVGALNLNTDFA